MKTLKRYYAISGRVVEEQASMLPATNDLKKPRGVRKAGASSERKIKNNEKSSALRLARELACNMRPGDALISCKYDAEHYPGAPSAKDNVPGSPGFDAAAADLRRFLRKLRRLYRRQTGRALRGFWETANWHPDSDGGHASRLHQHLVIPSDAVAMVRQLWPEFGGVGTVNVKDLNTDPDRTALAEYLVGNVAGRLPRMKGWSCSRGLDRPVLSEPEEIRSVDELRPPPGAIIKGVREVQNEDGLVVGKYFRYVLPAPPKVRGGQIVMPRPPKRGGKRDG